MRLSTLIICQGLPWGRLSVKGKVVKSTVKPNEQKNLLCWTKVLRISCNYLGCLINIKTIASNNFKYCMPVNQVLTSAQICINPDKRLSHLPSINLFLNPSFPVMWWRVTYIQIKKSDVTSAKISIVSWHCHLRHAHHLKPNLLVSLSLHKWFDLSLNKINIH